MKKSILVLTLLFAAVFFVNAQDKNIGVGLAYGTDVEKPALFVNGQYFFNDEWAVAPSLIFYLPDTQKSSYTIMGVTYTNKTTTSFWEFNADANYYFTDNDKAKFYGLAGFNITGVKFKYDVNGTKDSNGDTEAGLNIGVGVDFNAGSNTKPFLQAKYTLGDADQLVLMGGVRFALGK